MTGAEIISAFKVYYDRVTSFSAPGYREADILLFLNNAQDQFIKDKVFGGNFQPPAFEDNQKRVVDILPLTKRALIASSQISPVTLFGVKAYGANKSAHLTGRGLYTVQFEIQVTRTNPVITEEYVRCEMIKSEHIGRFVQNAANRTHFIYPKLVEEVNKYYVICDYYTDSVLNARATVVVKPYPITAGIGEYDGTYGAGVMNLHNSVHQEIVDLAVRQALQSISDPRFQTNVAQGQIDTN